MTLVIGGGGSMILRFGYSGSTVDIDAVPVNSDFEDLKPHMEAVARELKIAPDWLNPHFHAFTHYLPEDSKTRMETLLKGQTLTIRSLGAEDLLIMKLMAGRAKDLGHIKHLLKQKPNLKIVDQRLTSLLKLHPQLARNALDLLDDLTEEEGT